MSDSPQRGDATYEPHSFALLPKETLWAAIWTILIPLIIVLLVAIHPWTLHRSPQPSSSSYGSVNGDSGGGLGGSAPTVEYSPITSSTTDQPTTDQPTTEPPSSTTDPAQEAAAITGILNQAHADRQSVVGAVQDAVACGSSLTGDEQALTAAESDRKQLAQTAGQEPVDALSGAASVPTDLSNVLSESATADGDFAAWVHDLESSCTAGTANQNSNYQAAQAASTQADQDKQAFLSTWNSIASQYGQQTWNASDI